MNDNKRLPQTPYDTRHKIRQLAYFRMIHRSDLVCGQSTHMDRRTFAILCHLLRTVAGLSSTKIVNVEEMVTMFLYILAHNVKNCNCLGVLDGTYIKVNMLAIDRPTRIHNRLVDSTGCPCMTKGLQMPKGYPNIEGFLSPYRGQRYHLQEWRGAENVPTITKKYFNIKHSSARNVIERTFGVLKDRWLPNQTNPQNGRHIESVTWATLTHANQRIAFIGRSSQLTQDSGQVTYSHPGEM
ncbi:retrotransposon protein [Cucumis melo var. makuwa]|uniref:Retrotransposon protein n=1 Tax=Cucumis melo var. makuwa TaxID=1194695 RepID=A0A5D3CB17_CUCMM|nr:retrotransposon protein [Cucumis melo var. makuwa]